MRRPTTLCLAAALTLLLIVAAAPAAAQRAGSEDPAPLAVPGKPSIPKGEERFAADCASCHDAQQDFGAKAWRAELRPADVARIVLGEAAEPADHPAVVTELSAAWELTGYVWSLGTDGPEVRRGEALALEAGDELEGNAVNLALFHLKQVHDLRSGRWVLNHTQGEVMDLMGDLAGERFAALDASDRQALAEYITLSYFVWPADW